MKSVMMFSIFLRKVESAFASSSGALLLDGMTSTRSVRSGLLSFGLSTLFSYVSIAFGHAIFAVISVMHFPWFQPSFWSLDTAYGGVRVKVLCLWCIRLDGLREASSALFVECMMIFVTVNALSIILTLVFSVSKLTAF